MLQGISSRNFHTASRQSALSVAESHKIQQNEDKIALMSVCVNLCLCAKSARWAGWLLAAKAI